MARSAAHCTAAAVHGVCELWLRSIYNRRGLQCMWPQHRRCCTGYSFGAAGLSLTCRVHYLCSPPPCCVHYMCFFARASGCACNVYLLKIDNSQVL